LHGFNQVATYTLLNEKDYSNHLKQAHSMVKNVPSTIPLPLTLVTILEAKFSCNGATPPERMNQWLELQRSLEESIETSRRFSSHEELESQAETSHETLKSLAIAIRDGTFDEATTQAFKLYHSMATYGALRQAVQVTTLVQTDKLIHACKACEDRRLPFTEAVLLLPSALEEIDVLVGYFKRATDSLPENVRQGLLKGIQSCQVGFSMLQGVPQQAPLEPGQLDTLRNAAANLRNGALILQELQSWGIELAKEGSSAIPAVGDFVHRLRSELGDHGQIPNELLVEWADNAFWNLQERWSEDRHDFFMQRAKKDQLVGSIDALLFRLKTLQDYSAKEQDEMLYLLELKFEEVEREGFDLEELRAHPLGWFADYLVAILSKGVPRPHIQSQLEDFLDTDYDIYGRFLQSYLAEDDRDYLLDAFTQLEHEVQSAL
jgi:hypothetical protein